MILSCDNCNCEQAKKKGSTAAIDVHFSDGWRYMSEEQRESSSWISCAECGKILKPLGAKKNFTPTSNKRETVQ